MAIKKSELYSSLWAMCDELRGGMDASQYKDYVLVMLFIKYISDKYAGKPYAEIIVPEGASFQDMVAMKGNPQIGDLINKKIIQPIVDANKTLGNIDVDFNNPEKLGSGPEMVKRLSNLIAIFENPELDFGKNKAEGDDILGDAYEYLMRHFATESGKSKGQFYTPAEVSRVMAKIIGINSSNTTAETTIYDPTCGSGSLLLKVADEAEKTISIYGQEKDVSTAALARMNMVLHNYPTAHIFCNGNSTLSDPHFREADGRLKTFHYVVANPPFSYKAWSTGVDPVNDPFKRFQDYGIPPNKNGDFAFLLHIVRSLKDNGKGAVILPHGVLFRGNAEAVIRRRLISKGYIKGIIGLPANLFYGTGIPACIIVIDKENAAHRKGIFMIDAGKGFIKDGNKNRLREQDIHKIVDSFNRQEEIPGYSRIVPISEIEAKEYNLNIPRYIDSQEKEDIQDIEAHLKGGIPNRDLDDLEKYWVVYPSLRADLFSEERPGYSKLNIGKDEIRQFIYSHPEFAAFSSSVNKTFGKWRDMNMPTLKGLEIGDKPKKLITELSEDLLDSFSDVHLLGKYDVYQHLMNYWSDTIQDDAYVIVSEGWKVGATAYRIIKRSKDKNGKIKEQELKGIDGIESKLIPPALIIDKYFPKEKSEIETLDLKLETIGQKIEELEEENSGEEALLNEVINEKRKITSSAVKDRLKEIRKSEEDSEERKLLENWLKLAEEEKVTEDELKTRWSELEEKVWAMYAQLSENEIKTIVVEDKWLARLESDIHSEMQKLSQRLTYRIKELAQRYEQPLSEILNEVEELEEKLNVHLEKMGFL